MERNQENHGIFKAYSLLPSTLDFNELNQCYARFDRLF